MNRSTRKLYEQLANAQARQMLEAAGTMPTPAPPSKYANTAVTVAGEKFDSSKEARRWPELERLAKAGQITHLKRQTSFVLAPSVRLEGEARKKPALRYFADFTYMRDGQLVVEDVKSRPTRKLAAYRIKRHLMATVHGIQITEI